MLNDGISSSEGDSLARAASNVLLRSFSLRRDQNVLVFADPGSLDVAEVLARVAYEHDIIVSMFFVPYSVQATFGLTESLPLPVEAAIREADAVLSCLSDRSEHLAYRLRVLRTSWNRRTKLAHAPGMTLDALRAADTDYGFIAASSRLLSLALLLGKQMEIITSDSQGRKYRLAVQIGGWDYPPGIDDGVITDGAWSNLPPGETYVVPQDGNGKIVINGSMPGRVLVPGEDLILTFRDGKLVEMQPDDSPAVRFLYETQISHAQRLGDPNWSNLAEVGFGLNPAVRDLTGIGLVDAKKADTVHVGLGHSASLGGDVDSVIKCDLVTERPTVILDGKVLLEMGQWRVNEPDWRPDHRNVLFPGGWWESITAIYRSGVRAERDHDRLVCHWNTGPGRRDSTPVGSEPTARLAAKFYDLLPERRDRTTVEELLVRAEQAGLERNTIPALLWVLRQYDLVRLPGERLPHLD
jgi:hypothetical protein